MARFEEARAMAARSRDHGLADKAIANRSMALIEMGEYEEAAVGLKEIILRSRDDETICGAAYNLSISLRRQNQYQKACFYARLANEKSRAIGRSTRSFSACFFRICARHQIRSGLGTSA